MPKPTRLILVNPATGTTFWGFEHALSICQRRATVAPLSLLTVAALTPPDWDIVIRDENVAPIDCDEPCDLVGITAMNIQVERAFQLADAFRRRGRTVVMGGPFATLEPDRCAPHVDVLVVGEAERTWPAFCRAFERHEHERSYVETEAVDLIESPVPRYDLLGPDYCALPIQTSRGCPFRCEFCDIVILQGQRVRQKPAAQVLAEVDAARRTGAKCLFFTDDNFVGDPRHARAVVDALVERRRATGSGPYLYTQASINLAEQPDLMARMVRAGFTRVFLGVETPRRESLREVGKRQNAHGDLIARVHAIQAAGLITWAGMIVGFDHDDAAIFEEQAEFLDRAGIAVAMVGMLNAPPRTPLHARLAAEGRLAPGVDWTDNCAWTNIVPRQMSRPQLFRGYADLISHLYREDNYVRRLRANIARLPAFAESQAGSRLPSLSDVGDLWRAIRTFTFARDPAWRRHFLPNFFWALRHHPARAVETAIHLGLWCHFARYVPQLGRALEAAAREEQGRGTGSGTAPGVYSDATCRTPPPEPAFAP